MRASIRLAGAVILAVILPLACANDPIAPDTGFSLKISVKDLNGNAVPHLRVSASNDILTAMGVYKSGPRNWTSPQAVTMFRFDAPVAFRASLTVHSMEGNVVDDLLDHGIRPAGSHAVNWTVPGDVRNGVYYCTLSAADTSGRSILFQDSILVALSQTDPAFSIIGWLATDGTFESKDKTLFPKLLGLPPIPLTDASGPTVIGTIRYGDSVSIIVTDTLSRATAYQRGAIHDGPNTMDILWVPAGLPRRSAGGGLRETGVSSVQDSVIIIPPSAWKLWQNYPNPFN